jgi:hypothetical protein
MDNDYTAKRLMARHLRREHRWGIRKIAKEIGESESITRRMLDELV